MRMPATRSLICASMLKPTEQAGAALGISRRKLATALCGISVIVSAPAYAQKSEGSVADRDPNAVDVAKTPVTDLNIDKEEIPELLIGAQRQPYDLKGLNSCPKIGAAILELDDLLGPDMDLPQAERDRISAGRVAKTVVGSLIPFRGLVREVSGANEHERRVRAAIQAGMARRGFLKGVGEAHKCKYPARSAPRDMVALRLMELQEANEDKAEKTEATPQKQP